MIFVLFLLFFPSDSWGISLNKRLPNIPKCCPIGLNYRRHPDTGDFYCGNENEAKNDEYYKKSIEIQYQILQKRTNCKVKLVKMINKNSKLQITVDEKLRINYDVVVGGNYCLEKDGEQNSLGVFSCINEENTKENEIDDSLNEIQTPMETKNRASLPKTVKNGIISKCCAYGEALQRRKDNVWVCGPQIRTTSPRDFLSAKNLEHQTHPTCMKRSKYYDLNVSDIQNPTKFLQNNLYIQIYSDYCLDRVNNSDRVMIFYC